MLKIDLGKLNLKQKLKSKKVSFKNKDIIVTKIEGKTNFYTKIFERKNKNKFKPILQLSLSARKINKKYPEISDFIKKNLIDPIIFREEKIAFENKRIRIELKPYFVKSGLNHSYVKKLEIYFKKEKSSKLYFVKKNNNLNLTSYMEFAASKIFENFGINTIKPHMAYFDYKTDIIIYDFTNLHTLNSALEKGIIQKREYNLITKKIEKLERIMDRFYKKKIRLNGINKTVNAIKDFNEPANIFVEKKNNKIKVYFTDLLIL